MNQSTSDTTKKKRRQKPLNQLRGSQEPRIRHDPEHIYSYGENAVALSRGYGIDLYDWQCDVLDSWLSTNKYGKWAAKRAGLLIPRQNGKTALLNMRELFGLTVLGERIVHTAHQQKTATEAFRDLKRIFQHPDLAKLVDGEPLSALGREEIRLKNGGVIKYIARTRASGLGFTADVLVLDEAQELNDAQIEALLPTISAAPSGNPQTIMVGAAPGVDSPGEVFRRYRKDGMRGKDKALSWFEWSVESLGNVADRTRWEETNPSLGHQLKGTTIDGEYKTMAADSFARQRLCWWPVESIERLIDAATWDSLSTDAPPANGKLVYAVRFSVEGDIVALAAAIKPDSGKPHIELIQHRSTKAGITWLVKWLYTRRDKTALIVIDGKAGAQNLIDRLRLEGVPQRAICEMKPSDVIAATTHSITAITEKTITHFDQPTLNEAAYYARKRPIGQGGGIGFGGIDGVDVTPLEACAQAYWGVMTTKRDQRRRLRIG